jgi:hypothetical protein
MALLAALLGGVGVAWLFSQMRPTVNDERRLRELSGLPVIGTVAMAWTELQKARRTRGLVGLVLSVFSLVSAYMAIMTMLLVTVSRV